MITPSEPWKFYPAAMVRGRLALREGCLLLGGAVVFWPHGSSWDPDAEAVLFDKAVQFEQSKAAVVGEYFVGGGGSFDMTTEFESILGQDAGGAVRDCVERTNTPALVAYPGD